MGHEEPKQSRTLSKPTVELEMPVPERSDEMQRVDASPKNISPNNQNPRHRACRGAGGPGAGWLPDDPGAPQNSHFSLRPSLSWGGNPARLPGVSGRVEPIEQARRIREVFGPVQPDLVEVEGFFAREMDSALPMIRNVAGWVLDAGGKRIRPALLLLISKMLGYTGHRAVRYGAVVELIHTATLIHDDIIDESELRRGRVTANRRWGSQAAVLVGDWLYTRTMDLCLELGDVEIMRLLTSATLRMIEGEILADQVRRRVDIDEATYMDITRRKTAELFAAACALPALFQPSTLHLTGQLATFGRSLGLCFQLIDDVLDFTSSEDELGKPVMADLREGRVTLPLILLLPRLGREQRERIAAVARDGVFEAMDEAELMELVRTSGVLEEVHRRARAFAVEAVDQVEEFGDRPEAVALRRAADLLLERTH